jgi:hypothetical protein
MSGLPITTTIELAVAALLIVGGIWLQVRGRREDSNHGSQGAVILLAIGLIMAIHGLGLLEYRKPEVGL